jgi:hypothetical protein
MRSFFVGGLTEIAFEAQPGALVDSFWLIPRRKNYLFIEHSWKLALNLILLLAWMKVTGNTLASPRRFVDRFQALLR